MTSEAYPRPADIVQELLDLDAIDADRPGEIAARFQLLEARRDRAVRELELAGVQAEAKPLQDLQVIERALQVEEQKVERLRRDRHNLVEQARLWREVGIQQRVRAASLPWPVRWCVLVFLATIDFYVFALATPNDGDAATDPFEPAFLFGGLFGLVVFIAGIVVARHVKEWLYARQQGRLMEEINRRERIVDERLRARLVRSNPPRLQLVVTATMFVLLIGYAGAIRLWEMSAGDNPNVVIFSSLIPLLVACVELYMYDPSLVELPRPTLRARRLLRRRDISAGQLERTRGRTTQAIGQTRLLYDEAEALLATELVKLGVSPAVLQGAAFPDRALADAQLTIDSVREASVSIADLDRVRETRERVVRALIEENARRSVTLTRLTIQSSPFFEDISYDLSPQVNLLLGKNGYGKSQLLRLIVAMAQQHSWVSGTAQDAPALDVALGIDIDGHQYKNCFRSNAYLTGATGVVPILALPEIRTLDRRATHFGAPGGDLPDLVSGGAAAFLDGSPFGDTVEQLYYELALDVIDAGGRLDSAASSVGLLQDVMNDLTDGQFEFVEVGRRGRTDVQILVRPEGSDVPVPLQQASQGALSVLALFGLIDSYRRALHGREERREDARSVVVIDEVDAHLHPQWQQVIVPLLRRIFPTMQFLLTCHSPFVVMGARAGEVAVLRKGQQGLALEHYGRDFIGTQAREVLAEVFRAEGYDQTFIEYSVKALARADYEERLTALEARQSLSALEEKELDDLRAELALIDRVTRPSEYS